MAQQIPLETYLAGWSAVSAERRAVAATILAIADAARSIATLIGQGALGGRLAEVVGGNVQGDEQKELDVRANELLIAALRAAPVAAVASEELEASLVLSEDAPLAVALDPLDGSSNIDSNVSIGTIFSIVPMQGKTNGTADSVFLQKGAAQKAAGYVIYGPHCAMVLTVGKGTQIYTLDRLSGAFLMTVACAKIPEKTREYAINASNARYWSEAIRAYVGDCVAGKDGPRDQDFNTRWIASLVAEAHRILMRGGVFLYPGDARKGYGSGRLRLIYEANPVAWLVEQAGGCATDGRERILDATPQRLHQRTPFVFGSKEEVERIARYKSDLHAIGERSPLFNQRGLFGT
ncbi:MAG: class 1 fructose-bisphosphatase [Hyphomicrobiaceae bacterium]|nr:MAG: class 1 fructose-bisphosphatase [Hyphomicrobiaceae bacterium]